MRLSDEELMMRCRNGDISAFELLVSRYKEPIIKFINYSIQDYHRAEDLAQETFLRVFKNASRYIPKSYFKNWLYRIASNLCKNELRNRKRHGLTSLDNLLTDEDDKPISSGVLTDYSKIPDFLYEKKEKQRLVKQAINQLPENQRLAIIMLTYQNLKYDEISYVLDCSLSAVKSLIYRARQNLKELLSEVETAPEKIDSRLSEERGELQC